MAYYETLVIIGVFALVVVGLGMFLAGRASMRDAQTKGYANGWNEAKERYYVELGGEHRKTIAELKDERDGLQKALPAVYKRGWQDSKQVYYTDLRNDRIEEEARIKDALAAEYAELAKENDVGMRIGSDLLMAYGVSTVGQLPQKVRDEYGIDEAQNSLDLETLIKYEQEV